MADIYDKKKRSIVMSKIRSKDTKQEEIIRKYLFSKGFRYRKNDKRYSGTPDIVLPKYNTIIFINGCFWHGHEKCNAGKNPKSNIEFWKNKINKNIERDKRNLKILKDQGWRVITIWECELSNKIKRKTTLDDMIKEIEREGKLI